MDFDLLMFTVALFTAARGCHGAVRRGGAKAYMADCIARALSHPWLLSGSSSIARGKGLQLDRHAPTGGSFTQAGRLSWACEYIL